MNHVDSFTPKHAITAAEHGIVSVTPCGFEMVIQRVDTLHCVTVHREEKEAGDFANSLISKSSSYFTKLYWFIKLKGTTKS